MLEIMLPVADMTYVPESGFAAKSCRFGKALRQRFAGERRYFDGSSFGLEPPRNNRLPSGNVMLAPFARVSPLFA
jgi:hypothetical protein